MVLGRPLCGAQQRGVKVQSNFIQAWIFVIDTRWSFLVREIARGSITVRVLLQSPSMVISRTPSIFLRLGCI